MFNHSLLKLEDTKDWVKKRDYVETLGLWISHAVCLFLYGEYVFPFPMNGKYD